MNQVPRRQFLLSAGAFFATAMAAFAQRPTGLRRIGFLGSRSRSTTSNPDIQYDAFVQGLRELGYVEGKNLAIEWRFVDGKYERLSGFAIELVKAGVEVIATHGTASVHALKQATSTIPIVAVAMSDPEGSGLVASLARPGGNITGVSGMTSDISPKQIELLKSLLPRLNRVAVLVNPGNTSSQSMLKNIMLAAQVVGVTALPVYARTSAEIERGFATMAKDRAKAVIVASDAFFVGQRSHIAELALGHHIAAISPYPEDVTAGSLIGYGPDLTEIYRRGASYVDRILKGARPSDLPIEQPMKIDLAINRKTAKFLGITIPRELLLRADRVVE